jgi:glycosyltransferase involved in cell wall biosynthesis
VNNENNEQNKDGSKQNDNKAKNYVNYQKRDNRNNYNRDRNNSNSNYNYRNDYSNQLLISVVIPLLNEEESLPELSLALEQELNKIAAKKWEVLFIDDGSTDESFEVIKQIRNRNNAFKVIRFRRNYGKSAALSVGFNYAKGKVVITMDADLQDDPNEITNLVSKLKEGYDLVSGWKKVRHDPINKTVPSKLFNFVTARVSGIKLHDFNCGLKAYRKEVTKTLQVYGEMHRYLPALAHWEGFKVTEIPVEHHPRRFGKSKFGMSRFFKGFLDLMTIMFTSRFLKRPLHFFGTLGILVTLIGIGIDLWLVIDKYVNMVSMSNRPLTLFGVALIIVGVQSISLGLIGEMIVKNNVENANYSIKDKLM